MLGSSPLARGLRGRLVLVGAVAGIIPARAGFTAASPRIRISRQDHPRSRGVYGRSELGNRVGGGSSPLARGLQDLQWLERAHGGIIPARAGFTTRSASAEATASDHPRSRGVYSLSAISFSYLRGSSPLARGLRFGHEIVYVDPGIIPARAGFTNYDRFLYADTEDHPRSRGVYCGALSSKGLICGSSPLARGLQCGIPTGPHHGRIIPARAGFTPSAGHRAARGEDHPRSRGVYVLARVHKLAGTGSSPLARGLPHVQLKGQHGRGIIPARAGFTEIIVEPTGAG